MFKMNLPFYNYLDNSLRIFLYVSKLHSSYQNGKSRGVLELSFWGDFRYTCPNAILNLLFSKNGGKVSQMTQKTDTSVTFHFCISILTKLKSKINIKFMLIRFRRFWGFQNCPWLSEKDTIHGFDSIMKTLT